MSLSKPRLFVDRYSKAYIAGLNSSRGYVLKDGENIIVFVDNRYYAKMQKIASSKPNIKVLSTDRDLLAVIDYLKANDYIQLFVDFSTINYQQGLLLEDNQIKLENLSEDRLRLVKTDEELEKLSTLAKTTEQVFTGIQSKIKLGQSEKQIAEIVREQLTTSGFDCESFPIIVAFGANSSIPHHTPTDKKLENNTNILIDFGGKQGNYNTDLTRNLFVGTPSDNYKQLYKQVYSCQQKVINGSYQCIANLQQTAYNLFSDANQLDNYLHNLGHGIGYEVHEYPDLNLTDDTDLVDKMVITIEPGLYLEGNYGVRIEDMVVVYNGKLHPLTKSPEEVICLTLT